MVLKRAFKHVERTVVAPVERILYVLTQRDFELASRVTLADLEQRISEAFHQSLKLSQSSFTYLDLPLFVRRPLVSHALNYDWLVPCFVAFDELSNSEVVDVNPLDVVDEVRCDLEHAILFEEVAVLAPLAQQQVRPVLRLHVAHLLAKVQRHAACQQVGLSEPHLLGFVDRLFVDVALDGQLSEEPARGFLLGCCLEVVLLACILLRKLGRLCVSLQLLVLLLPELLLRHRVVFMLLGVPDAICVDHCWLWDLSRLAGVEFLFGQRIDNSWQLDSALRLDHI